MKWIRKHGNAWQTKESLDDKYPHGYHGIAFDMMECEEHSDWREIESGVWDAETGKFKIKLKEPVKVPTLVEAVGRWIRTCPSTGMVRSGDTRYVTPEFVELVRAYDREPFGHAKPSKYDEKLVDELLDNAWLAEIPLNAIVNPDYPINKFRNDCSARCRIILKELKQQKQSGKS